MTVEPLHDAAYEPEEILRRLPAQWHEKFLSEYREALNAAHDVWRFRQSRDVLHLWRLRATAFSRLDFEETAQAAREGRSEELVPAEQVIPG